MTARENIINKLFRISGILLIGGLVVELITLLWFHPMSFLVNMSIGGFLIGAGVVIYLYYVATR